MDLILIRHGGADAALDTCVGHSDPPLAIAGFTAIQRIAASWNARAPRFLFSSDLHRAQQSAQVLASRFAVEPILDERLREMDYGEWNGRAWSEVIEHDTVRHRQWSRHWAMQPAPQGESFADVMRRTGAWLSALLGSTAEQDMVLAVAHRGSIQALLCHALGLAPERAASLWIDPAHATRIACRESGFAVCYLNVPRFETE